MWITQVKDMSYELEEPFKCNFRQRELNYYRYLVYMLENGKAYELFNYSSPFTFVEYYPQFRDREWIHSYQFDGLLNIYVLNFLSFVKEHAPEIEIWKEQFYALYEMEETLPEYCNWLIAHLLSLAIYPSRCEKPFIDENRMVNFIRKSKDNFLGSKKYSEELKKLLIEKIKSINKHSLKHHIYLK